MSRLSIKLQQRGKDIQGRIELPPDNLFTMECMWRVKGEPMALEQWQYKDPMLVLMEKQDQAGKRKAKCGRCIHYQTLVIAFEIHHGCAMKRRNWQACTYFETKKGSI